jgi:hypothetical protein
MKQNVVMLATHASPAKALGKALKQHAACGLKCARVSRRGRPDAQFPPVLIGNSQRGNWRDARFLIHA